MNSLDKFETIKAAIENCGASMDADVIDDVAFIPLLGWYDHSFGVPDPELADIWMDFRACCWPSGWSASEITDHFIGRNDLRHVEKGRITISFSHFVPRIDLMPDFIPPAKRKLYPVLGSHRLERLVREIQPDIHVYGHSHVNRDVVIDGINYINNAFAYPYEERISNKALRCIHRTR